MVESLSWLNFVRSFVIDQPSIEETARRSIAVTIRAIDRGRSGRSRSIACRVHLFLADFSSIRAQRSVLPRPLFAFDCELWAIANQDSDYSWRGEWRGEMCLFSCCSACPPSRCVNRRGCVRVHAVVDFLIRSLCRKSCLLRPPSFPPIYLLPFSIHAI